MKIVIGLVTASAVIICGIALIATPSTSVQAGSTQDQIQKDLTKALVQDFENLKQSSAMTSNRDKANFDAEHPPVYTKTALKYQDQDVSNWSCKLLKDFIPRMERRPVSIIVPGRRKPRGNNSCDFTNAPNCWDVLPTYEYATGDSGHFPLCQSTVQNGNYSVTVYMQFDRDLHAIGEEHYCNHTSCDFRAEPPKIYGSFNMNSMEQFIQKNRQFYKDDTIEFSGKIRNIYMDTKNYSYVWISIDGDTVTLKPK